MNGTEAFAGVALAVIIGASVYCNRPPSSVEGKQSVPTTSVFHLWRSEGEADGTLSVRDPSGAVVGNYVLRDNGLFEPPEQAEHGPLHVSLARDFYLGDPGVDVGAFESYYRGGGSNTSTFQAGVRVSPARFLYGTISPDLALTPDAIGAGISVYPPPQLVGAHWHHLGIGAWYLAPFDRGSPGWAVGAAFSIR